MDALLDRLWELANQDDEPQTAQRNGRITEARALWRALEVLLSSLNAHDFCVGDGTFTKTLACIRSVLSDSSYWRTPSGVSLTDDDKATSVFVCVNRVLLKVAGRGPKEREALVRDGVADLMVRCCDAQPLHQGYSLSAAEGAAALQTLHALAAEAKSRAGMLVSQTIRLSSQLMQKHESVFAVQLRGCQFLHQMSLEEDSKERIGRQGGLQALTKALMRFPAEKELVVIALDLLLLLCWELEYREGPVQSAQYRSVNSAVLHGLVNGVVSAMRMLKNVELIQANGIAILNKIVIHPPAKQALCSSNIWDVVESGLSASPAHKVGFEFVALLEKLLSDPLVCDSLRKLILADDSHPRGTNEMILRLKELKRQMEELCCHESASKESEACVAAVTRQLHIFLNNENREIAVPAKEGLAEQLLGTDQFGYSLPNATEQSFASTYSGDDSGDEFPVDSGGSQDYADDARRDDTHVMFHGESDNYFDRFVPGSMDGGTKHQVQSILPDQNVLNSGHLSNGAPKGKNALKMMEIEVCSTCSIRAKQLGQFEDHDMNSNTYTTPISEPSKWQALYEASSREVQRMQLTLQEQDERYRVVLRRAHEQAKLLSLQNVRLASHTSEQLQVLRQLRSLERSLDAAERRCQAESALRSAETIQCEQLSLALNESMREAKSLALQQSGVTHELQQHETMRTEYMMRSRESKRDKERVETERDSALMLIEILTREKEDIQQQLADCKREGFECLLMREEDVSAKRPGVFAELTKVPVAQEVSRQNGSSNPYSVLALARRNSLPTGTCNTSPPEAANIAVAHLSLVRSASVHSMTLHRGGVDRDFNDDPNSVDTAEIQSCLISVFQSLDTSTEGSSDDGVHVSTIRRFFLESGLIQSPHLLPADVDVVLASVLAQSQSNRRNPLVRKDFSSMPQQGWAPPHGWAKTKKIGSPTKSAAIASDATRYRFFNQDAFNEAVTLVGIRRFPRSDLLSMLQTMVALYLRPYMRQQRTRHMSITNQRGASLSSCGSTASRRASNCASSPSQVCNRAMKAILNGLALHLGHGNKNEELRKSKSAGSGEGEIRFHSHPPSLMNQSHRREDVVYSMLEMNVVLSREQRPLGTICEFYSSRHHPNAAAAAAISIIKNELFGLSFELVLNFAMDFELIPSFMDRVSLKRLHTEVAGLLKVYFAIHDKDPPSGADAETLKKVAFGMILARLALEIFGSKVNFETSEQQITGLLQWLDNSTGREKIMRKAGIPLVIRFSRQLYAAKM